MVKIILIRSQFLVYLLSIEFIIVINYCIILVNLKYSTSSYIFIFIFMVTIVIGAVIGIRMIIAQSRSSDNQLEIILMKG